MSCGEFHSQPKKLDDLTKLTSQKMCFPSSQSAKEIQEIKKRKESKENQDIKLIEEITKSGEEMQTTMQAQGVDGQSLPDVASNQVWN